MWMGWVVGMSGTYVMMLMMVSSISRLQLTIET
jgi:hypothetical protein